MTVFHRSAVIKAWKFFLYDILATGWKLKDHFVAEQKHLWLTEKLTFSWSDYPGLPHFQGTEVIFCSVYMYIL